MIIFEGDKFIFLSWSAGGKMKSEREREAEFPGGVFYFRIYAEGGWASVPVDTSAQPTSPCIFLVFTDRYGHSSR